MTVVLHAGDALFTVQIYYDLCAAPLSFSLEPPQAPQPQPAHTKFRLVPTKFTHPRALPAPGALPSLIQFLRPRRAAASPIPLLSSPSPSPSLCPPSRAPRLTHSVDAASSSATSWGSSCKRCQGCESLLIIPLLSFSTIASCILSS